MKKEAKKEEPKRGEEALIIPPDAVSVDCKDTDEVIPVHQRAWCWCMCFGVAFMLAGVILGGAYLYKYFAFHQDDIYYCGIKYIKDDLILNEPSANAPAARFQTIEENIKILEEDNVEFISVPVPEFADSDPANIVHDFHKKLTAYLDLNLDKCYVIPLNTSIMMPPKNLLELLINIKAGTYLPQSYLIHEHMFSNFVGMQIRQRRVAKARGKIQSRLGEERARLLAKPVAPSNPRAEEREADNSPRDSKVERLA
ncbi:integral membrane protein 2B-like [Monodelphis domestica]|uniref:integral membrane protein 2B-like n=1 Tax=Monodelphis domestica TaxID=13616 RepID=UPI0024E2159B|nr:integral membrane protein 2B-like [Monodelphis domestica]